MLISFKQLKQKYDMNISGVIHIGAHFGQEAKDYLDNGIAEMVFFEPLSENLKVLEENLSYVAMDANVMIYPVALGNEEKEVEMYVSNRARTAILNSCKFSLFFSPTSAAWNAALLFFSSILIGPNIFSEKLWKGVFLLSSCDFPYP